MSKLRWFPVPVLLLALLLAGHGGAAAAQPADPEREALMRQLRAELAKRAAPKPSRQRGAHAQSDPHAALDTGARLKVALQHHAEGRTGLALETLDEALRRDPGQGRLLAVRGSLLLQQGDTVSALRDLEAAVALRPKDPAVLVNRAQAYRRFGERSRALQDLDEAIGLDPEHVAARFNRGSMHFDAQDFEAALADFVVCVSVDPHAPPPHFNLAMTREQLGDRPGAIADLKRFLELAQAPAWRELGERKLAELSAASAQ